MTTESILRKEEAKRLDLYFDTLGVATVGIGYAIGKRGLPDDIVEELFKRDLDLIIREASTIPEYAALDDVRKGVLERMVFQLGLHGVMGLEEAKRLDLYFDTLGVATVGIGYAIGKRGLPDDIVEELFKRDLDLIKREAALIPEYAALDEVRRGVLERMVFQLGLHGVMGFKDMRAALADRNWVGAAKGALDSKWARETPQRADREARRILTGVE